MAKRGRKREEPPRFRIDDGSVRTNAIVLPPRPGKYEATAENFEEFSFEVTREMLNLATGPQRTIIYVTPRGQDVLLSFRD